MRNISRPNTNRGSSVRANGFNNASRTGTAYRAAQAKVGTTVDARRKSRKFAQ